MEQKKSKGRRKKTLKPEVEAPVMDTASATDTAFPADKPDYIRMFCNRCGKRLTLKSLHPETPGLGPYQGYCRFPCGVEYIVQVNLIG